MGKVIKYTAPPDINITDDKMAEYAYNNQVLFLASYRANASESGYALLMIHVLPFNRLAASAS